MKNFFKVIYSYIKRNKFNSIILSKDNDVTVLLHKNKIIYGVTYTENLSYIDVGNLYLNHNGICSLGYSTMISKKNMSEMELSEKISYIESQIEEEYNLNLFDEQMRCIQKFSNVDKAIHNFIKDNGYRKYIIK